MATDVADDSTATSADYWWLRDVAADSTLVDFSMYVLVKLYELMYGFAHRYAVHVCLVTVADSWCMNKLFSREKYVVKNNCDEVEYFCPNDFELCIQ